jgi:hypothetical protein
MTTRQDRLHAEAETDRWLARLQHVETMIKDLRAFVAVGDHLEDCLVSGEGRHRRTHIGMAVDEMQAAIDSLEREERRIRYELDERGIAP